MKSLAAPGKTGATDVAARTGQIDALEAEQPDRPQLTAATKSNEPLPPSNSELRLEDARKLTRDNPAAVANIVKTWINGEAPA
jgi:flagellar M-ring protein FliF